MSAIIRPAINLVEPFRSEKYLAWVRRQASAESGRAAGQAHHVIGHGRLGKSKHSDLWSFPLSPLEHDALHHILGYEAWEEQHGSQLLHALKMIDQAAREGVLVVAL